ncbi:hypothetical protein MYAM1_003491 [Malassezia yamatoensis]|uniref:Uncharacterized protein n=1 Tax=Malassezia yamatoensis TaxID=253288 RepID=A0AAJ6CJG5_9BASI|nr:hypothetical protein MYAM1_003491 [Malassezia yamatoensis]
MLQMQKKLWPAANKSSQAAYPGTAATPNTQHAPLATSETKFNNGIDASYLSQRLSNFLIDGNANPDQSENVWDRWQGNPAQDAHSFCLLDKPQTAAPPVTPPGGPFSLACPSQTKPSEPREQHASDDWLASLSFGNMSLGDDRMRR